MNKYIETLNKLLNKAIKIKCVPVSAIVVRNNKIIAKGYNKKEKTNNPLDHAEIIAITKAVKKAKTWKLNDCELYVTMKPCKMCDTLIKESRISKVYYLVENNKETNKVKQTNYYEIENTVVKNNYIMLLKTFFKKLRNGEK